MPKKSAKSNQNTGRSGSKKNSVEGPPNDAYDGDYDPTEKSDQKKPSANVQKSDQSSSRTNSAKESFDGYEGDYDPTEK